MLVEFSVVPCGSALRQSPLCFVPEDKRVAIRARMEHDDGRSDNARERGRQTYKRLVITTIHNSRALSSYPLYARQAVVHGVTTPEVVRQEAATHEKHFYPGPNCASSLYFKIAAIEDVVGVAALESWAAVNLLPVLTAAASDVMARITVLGPFISGILAPDYTPSEKLVTSSKKAVPAKAGSVSTSSTIAVGEENIPPIGYVPHISTQTLQSNGAASTPLGPSRPMTRSLASRASSSGLGPTTVPISEAQDRFNVALAAILSVICFTSSHVNLLRHLPPLQPLYYGLLNGARPVFDFLELIGDAILRIVAYELVQGAFPSTVHIPRSVCIPVVEALCCNRTLIWLAKIHGIVQGPVPGKGAADFLEAIIGMIAKELGIRQATAFITEMLQPLVEPAIRASRRQSRTAAVRTLDIPSAPAWFSPSPSAFTFIKNRLPIENSMAHYRHRLPAIMNGRTPDSIAPSSTTRRRARRAAMYPEAATSGDDVPHRLSGSKRPLPTDDEEESLVADMLLLDGSSSGEASAGAAPQEEDVRPLKKRKLDTSVAKMTKGTSRIRNNDLLRNEIQQNIIHDVCADLESLPSKLLFFPFSRAELTTDVDADFGKCLLRYILVEHMDDVWSGMSVCAASVAVDALVSDRVLSCIAECLNLGSKESLLCAVAHAYRQRNEGEFRRVILGLFALVIARAVRAVRPLWAIYDRSSSLENRRTHFRDVLRMRDAGYIYHSGLTPMTTSLTTSEDTYSRIFNRVYLRQLRLI
ncbi:hypothetical protein EV714DRAFT_277684 [Schizophyllum commune]